MRQLLLDVKRRLDEDSRVAYLRSAGGVVALSRLEDFPHQFNTPMVVLVDGSSPRVIHLSSRVVWKEMRLRIHCIDRVLIKSQTVTGGPFVRSVEEIALDVRKILDMDRIGGRYARAFYVGDDAPTLITEDTPSLQEKALTFEYVRIES